MTKPIVYTRHAESVIAARNLDKRWVETTVLSPEWRQPDPSGGDLERRFAAIAEREGRILRVVCTESGDIIRVISAFLDRDARRPQ